ncbi:MAG: hypothetical protein SH809_19205 [Rhodothermales bacterium]|nr:hypothetical protein [Rhodothermales bacterium]
MRYGLLVLFLAGCAGIHYPAGSLVEGDPQTLWMKKVVSVGKQCVPAPPVGETVDALLLELADADLAIYDHVWIGKPTCRGCDGCPAYHGDLFIRAERRDVHRMSQMGYEVSMAPEHAR